MMSKKFVSKDKGDYNILRLKHLQHLYAKDYYVMLVVYCIQLSKIDIVRFCANSNLTFKSTLNPMMP